MEEKRKETSQINLMLGKESNWCHHIGDKNITMVSVPFSVN